MVFEQLYLGCLSQASYLVGDSTTGRAVVVDPRRDVGEYLSLAADHGLTIEMVIETHFHADFVSGHLELAAATGAEIAFGAAATTEFPSRPLADGERISLGEVTLEVRATPGHTPESISVVVWERPDDEVPYGVLTGDTLFIGDVGRPDLLSAQGVTADELARALHRSLHTQLLTLPDATRVFPAHGAGSACGKHMSTETSSTIGEQRRTNYALQAMPVDEFVAAVTEGQRATPAYFAHDAGENRRAHALLTEDPPASLPFDDVVAHRDRGAVVIDTRSPEEFARGHLRGSINVGLEGRFAEMVGAVVPAGAALVLVCSPGTETEAKVRLGRIGLDGVAGHLDDPLAALAGHPEEVEVSSRLTPEALAAARARLGDRLQVVDVRDPGERAAGAIDGSVALPMTSLREGLGALDATRPTVVHCAGGYRSSIATSVLRAEGFTDVSDLIGGYGAWEALAAG